MSRTLRLTFLLLIVALVALPASAQGPATGTLPFGSFGGGPDVINLANLNSHIAIPVLHKPGRGTNFTYNLSYDTSVWYPMTSGSTQIWAPVYNWGWRAQTEITTGYVSNTATNSFCYTNRIPSGVRLYETNFVYHDPWGVPHPFAGTAYQFSGTCGSTVVNFSATSTHLMQFGPQQAKCYIRRPILGWEPLLMSIEMATKSRPIAAASFSTHFPARFRSSPLPAKALLRAQRLLRTPPPLALLPRTP
jgi:hypothetical protein